MERLGVFGGTFDPVHVGHVVVATESRAQLALDRVLLVVAGDPWQKRDWEAEIAEALDRHWRLIVVLVWLGFCAWFIYNKWLDIRFFALGDTDDNMRMMQVRGLLH